MVAETREGGRRSHVRGRFERDGDEGAIALARRARREVEELGRAGSGVASGDTVAVEAGTAPAVSGVVAERVRCADRRAGPAPVLCERFGADVAWFADARAVGAGNCVVQGALERARRADEDRQH